MIWNVAAKIVVLMIVLGILGSIAVIILLWSKGYNGKIYDLSAHNNTAPSLYRITKTSCSVVVVPKITDTSLRHRLALRDDNNDKSEESVEKNSSFKSSEILTIASKNSCDTKEEDKSFSIQSPSQWKHYLTKKSKRGTIELLDPEKMQKVSSKNGKFVTIDTQYFGKVPSLCFGKDAFEIKIQNSFVTKSIEKVFYDSFETEEKSDYSKTFFGGQFKSCNPCIAIYPILVKFITKWRNKWRMNSISLRN